jgi:hypothetical protein
LAKLVVTLSSDPSKGFRPKWHRSIAAEPVGVVSGYRENSIEPFSRKIENNFPVLVHAENSDKIQNHHIEEKHY